MRLISFGKNSQHNFPANTQVIRITILTPGNSHTHSMISGYDVGKKRKFKNYQFFQSNTFVTFIISFEVNIEYFL